MIARSVNLCCLPPSFPFFFSFLFFFFFFFLILPVCEGECRTPAWQIGKLPNDKLTATATTTKKLKPVTRETTERGTNKHLKRRDSLVHGGVGAGVEGGGHWEEGGGLRYDCRGWMETIKQHSKGGTVVTQRWCRYVTKPKHTTRRACVCVCVCIRYEETAHSIVGSGVKDTTMKVFLFKNSCWAEGQAILTLFLLFPVSENSLTATGLKLAAHISVCVCVCVS